MPCDMGMDSVSMCDSRISDLERQYKRDKKEQIQDKRYENMLIGMLCALCTEVNNTTVLNRATRNGKCRNIKDWYKDHMQQDILRLQQNGLPDNASNHEKKVYKLLKEK